MRFLNNYVFVGQKSQTNLLLLNVHIILYLLSYNFISMKIKAVCYQSEQLIQYSQQKMSQGFFLNVDKNKAIQLIIGILGVNIAFLVGGIQYQKITTQAYLNSLTGQPEFFRTTAGFIMVQRFINWMLGLIYQSFTLPKTQRVTIASQNAAKTGFIIYLSSIVQTEAMYLVSYPLIIMAKSCGLLNVILVGIFCSRVTHKQLKLGPQKIVIAIIVTVGIVMFRLFDPTMKLDDNKKTEWLGLLLLLVSLFADGFIPDFQAQIKEKFKPAPIEMLITLNKWTGIWSLIYLIVTNKLFQFAQFLYSHPGFVIDLLILSISAFIGQIFVYRMIKQFKQHIVPFVVTTRKIITVGLSLIYFKHATNLGQISAIIIVFFATAYQFLDSIMKDNKVEEVPKPQQYELAQSNQRIPQVENQQNMLSETNEQVKDSQYSSLRKGNLIKS